MQFKFEQWLNYLRRVYFTTDPSAIFSFFNSDSFNYFYNMNDDVTSNCVESMNNKVNTLFHVGKKTVRFLSTVLTEFRKKHSTDRQYALMKNDKRYFRLRSKKKRELNQKRRRLVEHFVDLFPDEQIVQLWTICLQIGEMGAAAPRFTTVLTSDE